MVDAPKSPVRILLVDDHALVRTGLRMLIEQRAKFKVVAEAANAMEAVNSAERDQPDVILLDLDLGDQNGLDIIPKLRTVAEQARILILTGMDDPIYHQRAVRMGAVGIVEKGQAADILVNAIERVSEGEAWLTPNMIADVLLGLSRNNTVSADPEVEKIALLTERENDVIGLICEGLQNKSIAERLSISETTVRHHLTSIFAKLEVDNRLELVIYAYRHGLTKIPNVRS